jgi:CHAT domain-containing protein
MDTTPEKTPLPQATKEVEMIEGLCQALQLKPIIPAQRRREDVLSHLGVCKIFHFAGHGMSDLHDPSRSCLLLEDWKSNPLTVADLRDRGTRDSFPFLGYLSACSTGVSKVSTLMDEGIHLVSALQLAGFRHVIGTLWAVYDDCCPDVARVVYEQLQDDMTDVAVCQGLHRAIKLLRDNYISELADSRDGDRVKKTNSVAVERPLYWVPFVHFGV